MPFLILKACLFQISEKMKNQMIGAEGSRKTGTASTATSVRSSPRNDHLKLLNLASGPFFFFPENEHSQMRLQETKLKRIGVPLIFWAKMRRSCNWNTNEAYRVLLPATRSEVFAKRFWLWQEQYSAWVLNLVIISGTNQNSGWNRAVGDTSGLLEICLSQRRLKKVGWLLQCKTLQYVAIGHAAGLSIDIE